MVRFHLKETVWVISSGNARFTMVHMKSFSDQNVEDIVEILGSKVVFAKNERGRV